MGTKVNPDRPVHKDQPLEQPKKIAEEKEPAVDKAVKYNSTPPNSPWQQGE